MSKRVLELVASSRGGGAVHVRDLVRELDPLRFAVQVAMAEDGGNVTREDFEAAGIPFQQVDIAGGFSLSALRRIYHLARGVDLMHVHGARAALFGRLAATLLGVQRPRLIYTIHGFAAIHHRAPKRQVLLSLERWLARVTDAWVCVSNAEQQSLLAAGVADVRRVHVIRNGIDVQEFARVQTQRQEIRKMLKIPADAFLVTTVCRLYRPRDFSTLFDAFDRVQRVLPRAYLLIVGDGPLRPKLEQRVASLGLEEHIQLLGMRRDVPRILRATDVFVLSSKGWEGLPLTVLEAMASSLPVIASDVGGTREAVAHGQTGYLFPPGDAVLLSHYMQALASASVLAEQMGRQGLARAKECFTTERMARETATLYERLLSHCGD